MNYYDLDLPVHGAEAGTDAYLDLLDGAGAAHDNDWVTPATGVDDEAYFYLLDGAGAAPDIDYFGLDGVEDVDEPPLVDCEGFLTWTEFFALVPLQIRHTLWVQAHPQCRASY